jgi:chromosomal replication initiation ATPase DnaA
MLSGYVEEEWPGLNVRPSCVHRLSSGSPTLRRIAEEVCAEHGFPISRLLSDYRRQPEVRWRQEFMWRAYQTGLFSYPTIGRFLGKDHTSVVHGVRAHAERLASEPHSAPACQPFQLALRGRLRLDG